MSSLEDSVRVALGELFEVASYETEYDIDSALGEITVMGVEYQMQISLIQNKKRWCEKAGARLSEVVKVHH